MRTGLPPPLSWPLWRGGGKGSWGPAAELIQSPGPETGGDLGPRTAPSHRQGSQGQEISCITLPPFFLSVLVSRTPKDDAPRVSVMFIRRALGCLSPQQSLTLPYRRELRGFLNLLRFSLL